MIEKITIKAKLKGSFEGMGELFGESGFNKMEKGKEFFLIEKSRGEDLKGQEVIDYRIMFKKDRIEIVFYSGEHKQKRIIELLPLILDVLIIVEDRYEISIGEIAAYLKKAVKSIGESIDKESIEMSAELSELKEKYEELKGKYDDLVRSSEENSRILIECERKRDELKKRLDTIMGISDDLLKEELFNWIKLHNGFIEVGEFARKYNIHPGRVEEGLNMLIREGYIRRKK